MSNAFHFDGHLAADPQPGTGDVDSCRIQLVRIESAERADGTGVRRQREVTVTFVAYGARAETLRMRVRRGDYLSVTARLENTIHLDSGGNEYHGYLFVVRGMQFDCRPVQLPATTDSHSTLPIGAQ